MKIEKLYTLSQFVDGVKNTPLGNSGNMQYLLEAIIKYNNFLKKPLKKEMFVNELEEPVTYEQWKDHHNKPNIAHNKECLAWQEAEKKVIFKGEFIHDDEFGIMVKESDGEYALLIDEDHFLYKHPISAIANMKLELQNVEL